METKQRTREAVTQPEESLDQKIQSLEMKMEQQFASMGILMGNMATFLTMQQERIRALEDQVYKEHTPRTVEKQSPVPPQEARQDMLATEKQRDYLQRLGVKDLAPDLTKEHASVLIEGRLRELRATKTAQPVAQPEHTAPKRTTAHEVRHAQKTSGRSHVA